jgi:putative MFS transporter
VPTNLQRIGLAEVSSDYLLRDSALLGLPLTLLIALAYGFWNSRRTIIVLSALTAVTVLLFAVLGDAVPHGVLVVLLVMPLAGIGSATAAVTAYGSEIYPTRIRSRGTGLAAAMTKAGGVLVLAAVLAAVPTPSLAVTSVIGGVPLLLAVLVFVRTGSDTHQRTLEDISSSRNGGSDVEQASVVEAAGADPWRG